MLFAAVCGLEMVIVNPIWDPAVTGDASAVFARCRFGTRIDDDWIWLSLLPNVVEFAETRLMWYGPPLMFAAPSPVPQPVTSPGESRFSAASELPSTPVTITPLTLSLILYLVRRSLLRVARSRPSAFCVTGFSTGSSLVLAAASGAEWKILLMIELKMDIVISLV